MIVSIGSVNDMSFVSLEHGVTAVVLRMRFVCVHCFFGMPLSLARVPCVAVLPPLQCCLEQYKGNLHNIVGV